ncbi:hypothetical protein CesoFtcFv8_021593 [Champsocephalus esox]|uniref:Uncharacterized protein n=1 Tax=Champsocephalus esox TaxID=159716 RepID=A0AAN8B9J0_9TELE|nr:hypothetical protein CesoFtcFv8_021593 [Champsocephalus esox]
MVYLCNNLEIDTGDPLTSIILVASYVSPCKTRHFLISSSCTTAGNDPTKAKLIFPTTQLRLPHPAARPVSDPPGLIAESPASSRG